MIVLPNPITHPNAGLRGPKTISAAEQVDGFQEYLPGGKTVNVTTGEHRWVIKVTYENIEESEYRLLDTALRKARITGEQVGIIVKEVLDVKVDGTSKVSKGKSKHFINVTQVDNLKGVPSTGDFIQLSANSKVYKIIDFESKDNSWSLMVDPAVNHDIAENETINFNPIFHTKVDGTELASATLGLNNLYDSLTYKFVECVE